MTDESVFAEALGFADSAARAAFLDRECAGNPALRREVENLLAAHAASNPLDRPPADLARTGAYEARTGDVGPAVAVGDRVGPYRLLERIGEGGMGEVWVADQQEPIRRRVALKLIKPGMDTRGVLARFEAERQALAVMDHPNIAKVLDAGTTADARPFFVMELVKGTPITEFCDARKLTPKQRLELFVPVCQAIQHAHMKGIIHRDIKPGNVLVALHDEMPVPKVIDFGVAKAVGQQLTEKTIYTGFGALVGTPAYMAPEQATFNQLDIDTRADVYALGVLLYELLAGSPPIDKARLKQAALDEVLRIVRDEEPPRPSQRLSTSEARASIAATRQSDPAKLSQLMKGELDWIVMKALEKDRTRRYESANSFAADVQRYLVGEQVQAVPPNLGYRLRKVYRRNRAAMLTAAAFAVVLLAATGISLTLGVLATRARSDAEENRQQAEQNATAAQANATLAQSEASKVKAATEELQANQILWDMQLVPLAYESGTISEANRLLDRHIPAPEAVDRRGFEWFYWDRQVKSQVVTERLFDREESARSTWALSDNGTRLARFRMPSRDNDPLAPKGTPRQESPLLTVWDMTTRRVILNHTMAITLPDDESTMSPMGHAPKFSPDGSRIEVEWNYGYRKSINLIRPGEPVGPQGPRLVQTTKALRQILDVATEKVLFEPAGTGRIGPGSFFSRDGRRFASITTGPNRGSASFSIAAWDLETGRPIIDPAKPRSYSDIAFSPPGDSYVTAEPVTERAAGLSAVVGGLAAVPRVHIAVRDLVSGDEKQGWNVLCNSVADLTVSPDGRVVAGTILDGQLGRPGGGPLPGITPKIGSASPVKDPRVGGGLDPGVGRIDTRPRPRAIVAWDTATGKELLSWPIPDTTSSVNKLMFMPTGTRLEIDLDLGRGETGHVAEQIRALDVRTGAITQPMQASRNSGMRLSLKSSPDAKRLIGLSDKLLQTWDAETGKPQMTIRGHTEHVVAYGFTPDSRRAWSLESSGVYKEWDLDPARPVEIPFRGGNMLSTVECAISEDTSRFAHLVRSEAKNAGWEYALEVRALADGKGKVLQPTPRNIAAQSFSYAWRCGVGLSRDGRRAYLTRSNTPNISVGKVMPGKEEQAKLPAPDLTVWDVESGLSLLHVPFTEQALLSATIPGGHVSAISPDGRTVATGNEVIEAGRSVRIRLFDVDTRTERPGLELPGALSFLSPSFSPDGRRLAAFATLGDKSGDRLSTRLVIWNLTEPGAPVVTELFNNVRQSAMGGHLATFRGRIVWHPDGMQLVVSHDALVEVLCAVHDASTGKMIVPLELPRTTFPNPPAVPMAVAFSPDGRRVAAFTVTDRAMATPPEVKVWDFATGKELLTLRKQPPGGYGSIRAAGPPRSYDRQLAFSGDGHRLVACEFGGALWAPNEQFGVPAKYVVTTWDATPVPHRGGKQR